MKNCVFKHFTIKKQKNNIMSAFAFILIKMMCSASFNSKKMIFVNPFLSPRFLPATAECRCCSDFAEQLEKYV